MESCIFCNIVNGTTDQEYLVFADENIAVFLDKYRTTSAGAICLIIPRRHIQDITTLDNNSAPKLMEAIKQTVIISKNTFRAKGIRIWQANGKAAGQSINHLHFHVVPCNSIWDRLISIVPGVFDIFKRHNIFLKNRQISGNKLRQYADKLKAAYKEIYS